MSFSSSTVDARTGSAKNTLSLRLGVSNWCAYPHLRSEGPTPGSYVGEEIIHEIKKWDRFPPGVATIDVPQFAVGTNTRWVVTSITLGRFRDDYTCIEEAEVSGAQLRAAGFENTFTAQTLAARAPEFGTPVWNRSRSDQTAGASGALLVYDIPVTDQDTGISSGRAVLTGPGTLGVESTFTVRQPEYPGAGGAPCSTEARPFRSGTCEISFRLPPDAPAGEWSISQMSVTNRAGVVTSASGLSAGPVTLPGRPLWAVNARFDRNNLDVWDVEQAVTLSIDVQSQQPLASAQLHSFDDCRIGTPVLPAGGTGLMTVPVTMPLGGKPCGFRLTLRDVAGNEVRINDIPLLEPLAGDPPTASGFTVDKTSVGSFDGGAVRMTMDVGSWKPGVRLVQVTFALNERVSYVGTRLFPAPGLRAGQATVEVNFPPGAPAGKYRPYLRIVDGASTNTTIGGTAIPASVEVDVVPAPGLFTATTARLHDTRTDAAAVAANGVLTVPVAGREGIPATGVTAVVLNVTVTEPTVAGHAQVWPHGSARPASSNLNWLAGKTVTNQVVVGVGADGKVDVANVSGGGAHFVVDVFGYFTEGVPGTTNKPGAAFRPTTPARLLDTRAAIGRPSWSPVPAGADVSFRVPGHSGKAVVLNVTVTEPAAPGHLKSTNTTSPGSVSLLNWEAGQTVANQVTLPVGSDGMVRLINFSGGDAHIVADIFGTYSALEPGSVFTPSAPDRVLDTREGLGGSDTLGANETITLDLSAKITPRTKAVVLNVVGIEPALDGHLIMWPAGGTQPTTSNLNWVKGQIVANLVTIPVTDGKIRISNRSGGALDLAIDLFGAYQS